MMEPIEVAFPVACPPADAFQLWTRRTSLWWPKTHTVTRHPQLEVHFEPRVGGRIFERTPGGDEHVWGEITVWEPPRRLAYRWHLRQDEDEATDVEVTFDEAAEGSTAVTIVHSGWERLGDRASGLRDRNHIGWSGVLPHFVAACDANQSERSIQ